MYIFQVWNYIQHFDEVWYLRVNTKNCEANSLVSIDPCNRYYTWISYQTSTAVSKSGKTEQGCCSTFWITCGAQVEWQEGCVCYIQLPWHGRRILSVTVCNSYIIHTIQNQKVQPLVYRTDVIKAWNPYLQTTTTTGSIVGTVIKPTTETTLQKNIKKNPT